MFARRDCIMNNSLFAHTTDLATSLPSEDWNQLCQVMNGYVYSQILVTACDLDLFTFLARNPGATLHDLQQRLQLSAYATRVLMLGCCAAGLAEKSLSTGGYFNSRLAGRVLVQGSTDCMIPFIQFNHQIQRRCSVHLTQALKEGRNAGLDEFPGSGATLYERLTEYPELECLFQRAMGAYTRLSPKMMDVAEFSEVKHVLDVGGGDASNAIRLCRRYAELKATVLDIPSVVAIARKAVQEAGLSDRITCVHRDMFVDEWPAGCDAVLLSHVVEIFAPEKILFLYRKAWQVLPPGGRLFVWTLMADDAETRGLQAAKSSMYFLCTASGEGMAYPGTDHEEWIREAGFKAAKRYNAPDIDHGALVALK
jgi:ubiquinone/menaquinone biosynthesis C-methylase UbiE